jgi:uncharacterized membrane protein YbhN (UPF0104 family)
MKNRYLRILGPLVILLVFVLAMWLLYRILEKYTVAEIVGSVRAIPLRWVLAALALTAVNYLILVGYDFLAVRYVRVPLALWKVALASFTGYACSYNIGATVAGTSVRYRLYSAWGMPPLKVLQLLVILGLTFWFGVFALAGVIFVADPPQAPAIDCSNAAADLPHQQNDALLKRVVEHLRLLFQYIRPIGVVLLASAAAYLGAAAWHKGSIKLFRWTLPVPPFQLTVYQLLVATADLLVAAWVLFLLMPKMPGIDYLEFVGIYMVAYVLVVLSHVPGGLGVLEPVILLLLPCPFRLRAFAALLVFRVIYFWVPLLIAFLLLAGYEFILRRQPPEPVGGADASP